MVVTVKILTSAEMRRVEEQCARIGLPSSVLMEHAGEAVAKEVKRILGDRQHVLILIGPGNNGGDGLVAARHLHDWGIEVSLYLLAQRSSKDPNFKLVQERDITCIEASKDTKLDKLDELLCLVGTVIDAVFGTGKSRPLYGIFAEVLDRVTAAKRKRKTLLTIALDLPSGLDADTGLVDEACFHASNTITLGFPKPGLFNFPGATRTGVITVADIGIPEHLVDKVTEEIIDSKLVTAFLLERPLTANKGSFGRVLVVAGSVNYMGAAYLACNGAIRVGAGLVTLATAASLQPILAGKLIEATYLPLPESEPGIISSAADKIIHRELDKCNVLLMGCGLGQDESLVQFIELSLFTSKPVLSVLDADALNTLAKIPHWWKRFNDDAILTPHPGEMARIAGVSIDEVQSDRMGFARKMAQKWHKTVVLKGAYTVVATSDGRCRVSPIANPGLASAGTGDVLAGAIAGLLAQGLTLFDAATGGVYLHGEAGSIVRTELGDTGMVASDLLPALPLAIKKLKET